MQRLFDVLFGVSLIALALSGLLAIPSDTLTTGFARVAFAALSPVTVVLFVLRRRERAKAGTGLMKPGTPGLTKAQATSMRLAVANALMAAKTHPNAQGTEIYAIAQEISRLSTEWKAARKTGTQTDAELQSLFLLLSYALDTGPEDRRQALLVDVADTSPFFALRKKVEELRRRDASDRQAYSEWMAAVGNTNMDHLLKDGWIPFLRSLSHPDPYLWHGIATDFHDIDHRGRLEAAFWILEQPECDRATASDFIRGFVANELFEIAAKTKDTARLSAFQAVINRYNAGSYTWFGMVPDAEGITPIAEMLDGPFDDKAVAAMMNRITWSAGIPAFPAPIGLLAGDDRPKNPMPGLVRSPYDFSDDAGLHLRYPGRDWRKTSSRS
ncbi:hypothetical protein E7811_03750 [Aliigemmobacter aestuarii]|uniref:DUF4274 domain-containing protein n=1 Tax=Aliigemmobacter aestuarii TaxID=1445661 RepID=A0A4S3MQN9_9RHOB|nr:hypothetical protein [Gemmobacter aestuarii]THD84850.1 hypothetical protein E7811_03750 [Gemmobacter aestuarii]